MNYFTNIINILYQINLKMVRVKVSPSLDSSRKGYTTDYYEDLKQKNKDRDEKEKKIVRNVCMVFIICIIIIIAICA